jgi:uncharacterized membrane protein SirB2
MNDLLLILHLFGFGATFAGFFGAFFVTTATNAGPAADAPILARMRPYFAGFAHAGILLLLVTGPLMLWLKWGGQTPRPEMFIAKMVAVVLLIVVGVFMAMNARKARGGDLTAVGRMPIYNRLATTCFLLAMVFAALTFG